jgi:hypothetical protein
MTVDIWIRDYNPPRCFQKKISGRSKHNAFGLGIIILQGVSRRKSLAGVNIMQVLNSDG